MKKALYMGATKIGQFIKSYEDNTIRSLTAMRYSSVAADTLAIKSL